MTSNPTYIHRDRNTGTLWYRNYKTKASIGLGITQIIIGAILIALNGVSIATYDYFSVGHGFWCGSLVT